MSSIPQTATAATLPSLLTLDEAAEILRIKRSLFFAEVLPKLRSLKIGRRRLIDSRDLAAYIDAGLSGGGAR